MTDATNEQSNLIGLYAAIDLILERSIMPDDLRETLKKHYEDTFNFEYERLDNDRN